MRSAGPLFFEACGGTPHVHAGATGGPLRGQPIDRWALRLALHGSFLRRATALECILASIACVRCHGGVVLWARMLMCTWAFRLRHSFAWCCACLLTCRIYRIRLTWHASQRLLRKPTDAYALTARPLRLAPKREREHCTA